MNVYVHFISERIAVCTRYLIGLLAKAQPMAKAFGREEQEVRAFTMFLYQRDGICSHVCGMRKEEESKREREGSVRVCTSIVHTYTRKHTQIHMHIYMQQRRGTRVRSRDARRGYKWKEGEEVQRKRTSEGVQSVCKGL